MKKILLMAVACAAITLNAQQKYEMGNPNDPNYDYLKEYKPLKEYIDREAYPNFKLGLALGAQDYINGGTVRAVANGYFDEVVTGNAMKMASVVNNNGVMNFNTVKNFVKKATESGLNIYGHTLAWHAQQPKGWLTSLIKDRVDIVPNEDGSTTWNAIATKDFRTQQNVGWTGDQEKFGFSFKYNKRDGMTVTTTFKTDNFWDVQYIAMSDIPCEKGETYKMIIRVKAKNNPDGVNEGVIHSKLGDWGGGPTANIPFTEDWEDVEVIYKNAIGNSFLLLQHGDFVGDIMISDITISHEDAGPIMSIPLSAEEKHDTLVYAMDKWIKGMMEATDGNVKAWDLANEAISGGEADSEGVYALQHDWENTSNDFFWQDHMGDLEYVRQACRLARKYYAEVMEKHGGDDGKLTLFINDYNLESWWDNNGKLKSLVKWIERWEADGVTKIDGIGSQMHISCHTNDADLDYRKKYIENSFKIMAESGKLVRISELDMGMDSPNGAIATADMTEAMHQRMADYYEWIVKKYFEIIPPAQQWGICQWCATDSPANSGWRANTPVGLWTLDWYRKHTYAGVARGLGADPNNPSGIDSVEESLSQNSVTVNLQGVLVDNNYKGIVVVGGKKVLRK